MKIFLIFSIFFIACQGSNESKPKEAHSPGLKKDSVENTASNSRLYQRGYYFTKAPTNTPPIDSVEDGYDSLQIRIWQEQGLFQHRQLYIFKYNRNQWAGSYYEMILDSNYANGRGNDEFLRGPQPFEVRKFKYLNPQMGWIKFIDSLITLRILDLPDFTKIPGMEIKITDASAVHVEIATSKSYRYYSYLDVESFSDRFWQAESIIKILSLLYYQLGKIPQFA